MPKNVIARLKDTKIRALLILGLILTIAIAIGLYFILKEPEPAISEPSVASKLPDISAIPGGATSERYQQLLEEENRKRAEAARKAGTSAIATIIGAKKKEGSETFGIEGQLLATQKQCVCPPGGKSGEIPDLDPARATELIAELEANPDRAVELLKQNPGLGKALCKQKPELAYQLVEKESEAANIILKECSEMAKTLAEKNPDLFKKLASTNPNLSKQLVESNPELFKQLMENDPEFAKQLAKSNPELIKPLMKNDPAFANKMAKANPDMVKALMKNDPLFAEDLAKSNPNLVKELMVNDPVFAKQMGILNPGMVKTLMLDDSEFAKKMAKNNPDMVSELMRNDPEFAKALEEKNPGITRLIQSSLAGGTATATEYDRARALDEIRRRAAQEAAQRQLTEEQEKQKEDLKANMDTQAKAIFQAWNEYTEQVYVPGEWAQKKEEEAAAAGTTVAPDGTTVTTSGQTTAEASVLFKAGTILFAVLDTAVNSDEPGPVLATIVDGRYKGTKLIGTMSATPQPGDQPPEKVTLNFNQMNIPDRPATISIQAVAIDPDTARTAIATDVDHHYLLRYGTLFASSFVTGYAKVLTSQGTVQTTSANGLSTTTTSPMLSSSQQIYAALGEVGQKFGEATASWFDIPPTITVDAGTGIGILFLADVSG